MRLLICVSVLVLSLVAANSIADREGDFEDSEGDHHRETRLRSEGERRDRDSDRDRDDEREGHGHHGNHGGDKESRKCHECEDLSRSCRDYMGNQRCFKPSVNYMKAEDGCPRAVISCDRSESNGPVTLETSREDRLFHGHGSDKVAKCSKRGRWEAQDVEDQRVSFRKVYCLENDAAPGYGGPVYEPAPGY